MLKPIGQFVVVKDGGLPNGVDGKKEFLAALLNEGFKVAEEKNAVEGDVTRTQWVCALESQLSIEQA